MELTVTLADRLYTAVDYMHLHVKERLELIKGRLRKMSPAPSARHQRMVGDLFVQIRTEFEHRPDLDEYISPFDVYLDRDTVVQPDITVCHAGQVSERGCEGTPYLVVEVVSLSSKAYDEETKLELYRAYGVKTYWLAYPDTGEVIKKQL